MHVRMNGAGSADTDQVLHPVEMDQFIGVDTHRRAPHAGAHDRHRSSFISPRIAEHIPHRVELLHVRQEILGNVLRAERISRQKNGLRDLSRPGFNMGSRNIGLYTHLKSPCCFYFMNNSDRFALCPQASLRAAAWPLSPVIPCVRRGTWRICPWDSSSGSPGLFCCPLSSAAPLWSASAQALSCAWRGRPRSRPGRPCPR